MPVYLRLEEFSLPMAFNARPDLGYSTAAIGKWHLADGHNGWIDHPNLVGFDHFSGLILGEHASYYSWIKVVDGEVSGVTGYTPVDKADDAIRWIGERGDDPWFHVVRIQSSAHTHCTCRPQKPGSRTTRT